MERRGGAVRGRTIISGMALGAALLAGLAPPAHAAQSACTKNPDYPAPEEPGQVFYLQRTGNANTVVYTANFDTGGRIDSADPVEIFWRRFAEDGRRKKLGFLERILAFGVRIWPDRKAPGTYRAHLVSYPALKVRVDQPAPGAARALLDISGRPAQLDCIYIELLSSTFIPEIGHIEIVGRALDGGERITQRLFVDQRAAGMAPGPAPGNGP